MKFQETFKKLVLSIGVFTLMLVSTTLAKAQDYKFKVHNNTKTTIKKVLVSEDGKKYGYFDIGSGIAPGRTMELVWDKSTNSESCTQYFKAVFSNGEESDAVKFDFCEEGLVLEFN
ncbi:MAG: hypothetical protein K1Y36_27800 [Blastocatellia bacterium]|nr:hypothetical protein [Blastocatellia bacterium]